MIQPVLDSFQSNFIYSDLILHISTTCLFEDYRKLSLSRQTNLVQHAISPSTNTTFAKFTRCNDNIHIQETNDVSLKKIGLVTKN